MVKIKNEHGLKLGYVQNGDKLGRVEKIVARHDEALLKKVK